MAASRAGAADQADWAAVRTCNDAPAAKGSSGISHSAAAAAAVGSAGFCCRAGVHASAAVTSARVNQWPLRPSSYYQQLARELAAAACTHRCIEERPQLLAGLQRGEAAAPIEQACAKRLLY
jgi:hypothetical protein